MKNYKTYIVMLVDEFNHIIEGNEVEDYKRLRETFSYFLKRSGVPIQLKTVCNLMDNYFMYYYQNPECFEANILRTKIQKLAA